MNESFMKKLLLLLVCCLTTVSIYSQSTIRGQLVGIADQKPLPYATVSVANSTAPEKSIKKFATDEAGNFSTSLSAGNYLFEFQFVGMNNLSKEVEVKSDEPKKNLGKIEMSESSTELDEISVTAQRPLVKVEIDKLTYNTKEDPEAATSNVLDVLRKVPLVTVDGEDNIQLKGSSSFKIYLNGKPSNMISNNPSQVLKSMPANSIKDIEVITDPGAKYDAEGVTGIINIITDKRVDDGYSGSVGANANTQGGYGGNVYLTTKYGKFGFTGNASYYRHAQPTSEVESERRDFAPNPANTLTQNGTMGGNGAWPYVSASVSFEPDTSNLFNFSASKYGGNFNSNITGNSVSTGNLNYAFDMLSKSQQEYGGLNLSADYQRSFKKKGELLTLSYRYDNDPNNSENEIEYNNVTGEYFYPQGYRQRSLNNAKGIEHTTQIDYVNPINEMHSIEAGGKYIMRDNSSRGEHTFYDVVSGTWQNDADRKNDLDHEQNIFAGYAGYGYKKDKVGVKLGLRGEYTKQQIHFMSAQVDTIVPSDFFDLVPSVTLSYQLAMTQTLRLGYNMRISRPGIWYLNPFVNDQNPVDISYGNPDLTAEQTHNFNLNYGFFAQKINLNATLSYGVTNNNITSYSFVEDGVTHTTYGNIGKNQIVGLNMYLSWTPNQQIRIMSNSGINYTDIQSTNDMNLRNSGFSGRIYSGATYSFGKDNVWRVGANAGLFSQRVQLQTTQSPYYFYSFNIMRSFFDKKLDINLSANSIFSKYIKFKSTIDGAGFSQKSTYNYPAQNVRLSITYRFGDLKSSIKTIQRGITNDDVKEGESGQGGMGGGVGGGGGS